MSLVPIVHLCFGGVGGQATSAQNLACEFSKHGINSGVVAIGSADNLMKDEAWSMFSSASVIPLRRRADVASMMEVRKAICEMGPRVVICHSHRHAPAAYIGMRAAGVKPRMVSVQHHSVDLMTKGDYLRCAIALSFADASVFLTEDAMARFSLRNWPLRGLEQKFVIANGVEIMPTHVGSPDGALVFGMSSRLVEGKRIDTLLSALRILRERNSTVDYVLQIAGDGPERPRLEALALQIGVADHVHFLGNVSRDEMTGFYAGLDVYAHSSDGENLSFALMEAARAGLPIVASKVKGVALLVSDGSTGRLVDAGDAEKFASAISEVGKTTKGSRMGRLAQVLIEDSYSIGSMLNGYTRMLCHVDPEGPWGHVGT